MPDKSGKYKHILVTGASSGIGAALAEAYAYPGRHLTLGGRNTARLQDVAARCRMAGAEVRTALVDVTERAAMREWIEDVDRSLPLDLVVANAGISGGTGGVMEGEDPAQARRIFAVNLDGVLNTVEPVLPFMVRRGHGQIALMSSLAAFRGWPGAPAYCASKAAVKVYGEGLRGSLCGTGVRISIICPGFVVSPMTQTNDFPMPFLMSAGKAARLIRSALEKDRGRIAFPLRAYFFAWLMAVLPDAAAQSLLRKVPAKASITNF